MHNANMCAATIQDNLFPYSRIEYWIFFSGVGTGKLEEKLEENTLLVTIIRENPKYLLSG